jgi:hypothetical protein
LRPDASVTVTALSRKKAIVNEKRFQALAIFLAAIMAGCKPEPPAPATHTSDLFGGRYFLEVETVGSSDFNSTINNQRSGNEPTVELAKFAWKGNTLTIDMGKLTFNGKSLGTLKEGDRVRVDRDGRLTVNGQKRE